MRTEIRSSPSRFEKYGNECIHHTAFQIHFVE